ncbi:hypothetical protein H9Y04_33160 [Streptomyces sp. TRM66268-LWL]|uniref:Nitroreductase n=1 Tax=Streptomyces polyasparticus TaxID=2767826 RepID=A0ABR7SPH9_9ACTN|nr:hypothetical protein [Streptomyces polyasparticus]
MPGGRARSAARADHAALHVVSAAVTAPSLHNSQPWIFTCRDGEISLYADATRRLGAIDPNARELTISCGAALFNLRLAMRQLGFRPVVRVCPDPGRPGLLARVTWGAHAAATAEEQVMHRAMRARHTYRGPFQATPLPATLLDALRGHARAEGAEFYPLGDRREQLRLADLVREAETCQRNDPLYVTELARWTRPPHDSRRDGVPVEAGPFDPDATLLAGRDFSGWTHGRPFGGLPGEWPSRTGLMVLLNTPHDMPQDWLRAGQALQRVLLFAAGHKVAAAFHTQPLELPALRPQVRTLIASGQVPQMILRLGHSNWSLRTPRRDVREVLSCT